MSSAQTLDVDFVLHGEGPASTWAAQAAVGQQLVMIGPARGYQSEIRTLPGAKETGVRWLTRGVDSEPGSALPAALSEFSWPAGAGRVYVGCEAQAMRRVRQRVVDVSGLDRERIVTRGYWRLGAVNHPDHDYATD